MAETNIATLSRELAAPILERLKNSLDNASIAGADWWILHPGTHTGLSWVYPGLDWKLNRDRIILLKDYASRIDIEVLIENISTNAAVLLHAKDFRRLYAESGPGHWPFSHPWRNRRISAEIRTQDCSHSRAR
jgi:sugar phosphate isomerase/epimerase